MECFLLDFVHKKPCRTRVIYCFMLFVCSEVQKAVDAAQSLHHRWSELLLEGAGASKEEMDWTTNELRNSLRSIEWDLEDLDETINILKTGTVCVFGVCAGLNVTCFLTVSERIVESNPKKFNLDAAELSKRKAFITSTRQTVKVCHRWHACMHVCVCVRMEVM